MRLTELSITNYKALMDVRIPMSKFGCLIGENNSGKSSILQALALFFSGTKLTSSYFFNETQPIRISVTFEDINDSDLARLADEHRQRVTSIIDKGRLVLVRNYTIDGKSSLFYNTLTPKDPRFSSESIAKLVKGQKAGQAFVDKTVQLFPELKDIVDTTMNQDTIKQKIQELADSLPEDQKIPDDQALPTGIDKSIMPMLPDPIYIPAVKDLADDIKTAESTPFGKILSILLQAIETKLPDAQRLFAELNAKLNCVMQPDGTMTDSRLEEVRSIEETLEKYIKESFAHVTLRVTFPPPELKTVFSSAIISVNDGVEGLIDSKGDGLRRALVFSILRSYAELKAKLGISLAPSETTTASTAQVQHEIAPTPPSYLLLFEEPELFLHPKAQHILFDALRVFSNGHHVLVTTHSPMFFGPAATETFVKLCKVSDERKAPKPFTKAQHVNLSDLSAKDQFQIICYENNNAAFFADTVVLVEGDSDYLVLPHIAKTLNPDWNIAQTPVLFSRITGKGNIRRYRSFFKQFEVRVPVIADLDLLINGFDNIEPDVNLKAARDKLLSKVDELINADSSDPTAKEAKDAHESGELRRLWRIVRECEKKVENGTCSQADLDAAVEEFFAWQRKPQRLNILKTSTDGHLIQLKRQLLQMLRNVDIYILERGAIEDYYPDNIVDADKPTKARDFCAKVTTRDAILACCGEQIVDIDGKQTPCKEFDLIFRGIFNNNS